MVDAGDGPLAPGYTDRAESADRAGLVLIARGGQPTLTGHSGSTPTDIQERRP
jgi:hypothetical protein